MNRNRIERQPRILMLIRGEKNREKETNKDRHRWTETGTGRGTER